jgi:hypothetical protein
MLKFVKALKLLKKAFFKGLEGIKTKVVVNLYFFKSYAKSRPKSMSISLQNFLKFFEKIC